MPRPERIIHSLHRDKYAYFPLADGQKSITKILVQHGAVLRQLRLNDCSDCYCYRDVEIPRKELKQT